MPYTLLTGSTGLLGQYLLRDLLLTGCRVAVLVRPSRRCSARQRVENVLRYWDEWHGFALPRPVVLEGDISQPSCGLTRAALGWLRQHCDTVLHSAASLSFVEEPSTGEPWKSNVDGVANVLELCGQLSSTHLAHVSTAYVCGRTEDEFREDQLYEGQAFSNPYEESKARAELLIRQADCLSGYTIFRPSIITGDSRTGYAATYHGFYTPLRVLQAIMSFASADGLFSVDYLKALSLSGEERKNFVPVDWVSDALIKILARQTRRNQTYALVTQSPVTVAELRDAFAESISERLTQSGANVSSKTYVAGRVGSEQIEEQFRKQFTLYQSYWRDECRFDAANSDALLKDTPCPRLDHQRVRRLAESALDANFGFPPRPDATVSAWAEDFVAGLDGLPSDSLPARGLTLRFLASGGGEWTVESVGSVLKVNPGLARTPHPVVAISPAALRDLAAGDVTSGSLVESGEVFSADPAASNAFCTLVERSQQLLCPS